MPSSKVVLAILRRMDSTGHTKYGVLGFDPPKGAIVCLLGAVIQRVRVMEIRYVGVTCVYRKSLAKVLSDQ